MMTRKWLPREEWLKKKEEAEGKEYTWKEVGNTKCLHEWQLDTYQPNTNLVSVVCSKCNSGIQIDGDTQELANGIINNRTNK